MPRSKPVAGPRSRRDDRPRVIRDQRSPRHLNRAAVHPALNGLMAAGSAIALTFGSLLIIVALGWVFAADHTSLRSMFAFTVDVWLAAHLLPVEVAGATWWLPPLLLTVGIVGSGYWAATQAVKRGLATSREAVRDFWVAIIGGYASVATLLAAFSATALTSVPLLLTPFAVAGVFGAGALVGVARATRNQHALSQRIPMRVRVELKAALVGVAVLLAGAAAVLSVALVFAGSRIAAGLEDVQPGFSGTVLILVLCLIYLPTMLVWVAAFTLGTGFSVGVDTWVAPWGVQMGDVPAVPLLTAVPTTHTWWYLALLVLPVLAGLAARRALPLGPIVTSGSRRSVATSLARTAVFAAVMMSVLALLADGGIGGRLAQLGPSPLLVAAATGAWFIVTFALVEGCQALWHRWRGRTRLTTTRLIDAEAPANDGAESDQH